MPESALSLDMLDPVSFGLLEQEQRCFSEIGNHPWSLDHQL